MSHARSIGRFLVLAVSAAALLTLAPALPASAGEVHHFRYENNYANAFWFDREQLADGSYRFTTYYVGVYQSDEYIYSDAYLETLECPEQHIDYEGCEFIESEYGDRRLPAEAFSMSEDLSGATLDAVYRVVRTSDGAERSTRRIRVVTRWTAAGEPYTYESRYETWDESCRYSSKSRGSSVEAEARGMYAGIAMAFRQVSWLGHDETVEEVECRGGDSPAPRSAEERMRERGYFGLDGTNGGRRTSA